MYPMGIPIVQAEVQGELVPAAQINTTYLKTMAQPQGISQEESHLHMRIHI